MITLVARHPKLAQYNIYVTMFYKILETFGTFLIWYSFFLVAFSLGFYIMLHKDSPAGGDDYAFFNDPWLSLVKTSTMFVGEIEFSDIPIDLENGLWPLGYIFLLGFIFLIGNNFILSHRTANGNRSKKTIAFVPSLPELLSQWSSAVSHCN